MRRYIKRYSPRDKLCFAMSVKRCTARLRLLARIKDKIRARSHLFIYACLVREVLKTRDIKSVRNLLSQVEQDARNWLLGKKGRLAIKKLYYEAIICCLQHNVHGWRSFFQHAKLGSTSLLQVYLRDYVLRRAGDYNEYLRLDSELGEIVRNTKNTCFFERLVMHYAATMKDMEKRHLFMDIKFTGRRIILIGISVWGEHYLNTLINYCFPSLLAPGNIPALCSQRDVVLLIHTNAEGKQKISQADIAGKIQAAGVNIVYRMLDETLLNGVSESPRHKYWHLGMVQSLDLYYAQSLHADYHLSMPDTIYSENHFAGLLNLVSLGHHAIIKTGYRTRLQGVCPAVEPYRKGDALCVPAADLTAIAVRHMHTDSIPMFITHKDIFTELPNIHVLILEGRESLHLLSPHQTVLYLDKAVLERLAKRYFISIDSELDKIIPEDVSVCCPKEQDGVNIVEISHDDMAAPKPNNTPIDEFGRMFWWNADSMSYWRFFSEDTIDPLNRGMISERPYMEDAEIQNAKQTIRKELLARYPSASPEQVSPGLQVLQEMQSSYKTNKEISALLANAVDSIRKSVKSH